MTHRLLLSLLFAFLWAQQSFAAPTKFVASGPLLSRSQNPLYLQVLALPLEPARTLSKNQSHISIETTFSNVFETDGLDATRFTFDMELWRTAINYSYGLSDNLDFRIEIPFISNTGGFLDAAIQNFHNAFGFPNGGRELVANGQFTFSLAQNGTTLINHTSSVFGLSDISLRFKWLFSQKVSLPFDLSFAGYLKLPTGRFGKGLSSKNMDLGLSAFASKSLSKRWHLYSQIGAVFLTSHATLDSITRDGFFVFGLAGEFQLSDHVSLIAQLTGNTALFKNVEDDELKDVLLDFHIGAAGTVPLKHKVLDAVFYQISFSEDITSRGPAVDFSLLLRAGLMY